jgi:hypothetical protein
VIVPTTFDVIGFMALESHLMNCRFVHVIYGLRNTLSLGVLNTMRFEGGFIVVL